MILLRQKILKKKFKTHILLNLLFTVSIATFTIHYSNLLLKQQPAFNRQFDMLIRDLKHGKKDFSFIFLPKIQNNWKDCTSFLTS